MFSRQKNHDVLIFDGTAIQCDSESYLTEFGRNAKKTTKKQIMEIKVYDTVTKEPVYYETIPGNVIDKTAFIQVLSRFDTKNAIIIVDKGFNTRENIDYLFSSGNYNFIIPFNDNSKKIKSILSKNKYSMAFKYNGKRVKGLKYKEDDRFYYVFNDPFIRGAQENRYIENIVNYKEGYCLEKLYSKENEFGSIAFVSNLDIDINLIYEYYKMRWEIEVNVKLEKNSLDNEVVRLHSTKGILGIRFLIQIEMIMMSRIYFKLKNLDLLKTYSIRQVLTKLGKTYKIFMKGKWILSVTTKNTLSFLNLLNIPMGGN